MKQSISFFLFLGLVLASTEGTTDNDDLSISAQCTDHTACSTHQLSCASNRSRILLYKAWRGYLRRGQYCYRVHYPYLFDCWCCYDDDSAVCREEVDTTEELSALSAACSGRNECRLPRGVIHETSNGTCCSTQTAFSSYVQYSCVPETRILDTFSYYSSISLTKEVTVALQRTGSQPPNHSAHCYVDAVYPQNILVRMYSYAVVKTPGLTDWSITVKGMFRTYVFNASYPAEGKESSMLQYIGKLRLPVQIDVHVESHHYPELVWIAFEPDDSGRDIAMDCFCHDSDGPETVAGSTSRPAQTSDSNNSGVTSGYGHRDGTGSPETVAGSTSRPAQTSDSNNSGVTSGYGHRDSIGNAGDDGDDVGLVVGLVLMVLAICVIAGVAIFCVRRRLQQRKNPIPRHTVAMDNAAYNLSPSGLQPTAPINSTAVVYQLQHDNANTYNDYHYNGTSNAKGRTGKMCFDNPAYNMGPPDESVVGRTAPITTTTTTTTTTTNVSNKSGSRVAKGTEEPGDQNDDSIYEDLDNRSNDNRDEEGYESGTDAASFQSGQFETVMGEPGTVEPTAPPAASAIWSLHGNRQRPGDDPHQYDNKDTEEQEQIYQNLDSEASEDYDTIPSRRENEYSELPAGGNAAYHNPTTTTAAANEDYYQGEIDWLTSSDETGTYDVPRDAASLHVYSNRDDESC